MLGEHLQQRCNTDHASESAALDGVHESVLRHILPHVSDTDVRSLTLVCRGLSRQVYLALGRVKLRLKRGPPGSRTWAARHSYITNLDITGLPDYRLSAEEVKLLPSLETLTLGRACRIRCLQRTPGVARSLKALDLSQCSDVQGLSCLSPLTNLTDLNLQGRTSITDKDLAALAKLTSLQRLNVTGCTSITDKGLKAISSLRALTELRLARCHGVTDHALLRVIPKISVLHVLDLSHCSVTDKCLEALHGLKMLMTLHLSYCCLITNHGMCSIAKLRHLQTLHIDFCELGSEGLRPLSDLYSLETLMCRGCHEVGDSGIQMLRGLSSLSSLNCAFTSVSGTGLHSLPDSLTELNLAFCPLLDHTISQLTHLSSLTSLSLRSSTVTDAGTVPLLRMTSLKHIDASCCHGVSDARLAALGCLCT